MKSPSIRLTLIWACKRGHLFEAHPSRHPDVQYVRALKAPFAFVERA